MTIVERVRRFVANPPLNEDGESWDLTLLPPLKAEEISSLELLIGAPLSPDCRELVNFCGGWENGSTEILEFLGEAAQYVPFPALKGRLREITSDGFGNFWFYWSTAVTPDLGPIYYYMHEGPMLFYQSARLTDFVDECVRFMTPPYQSLIDDVHEFRLKPIRDLNKDLIERDVAIATGDEELRTFAAAQSADCLFYDFRRAKIGDGVDLQKLRICGVHEKLPILAVTRQRGLFQRLFGGAS